MEPSGTATEYSVICKSQIMNTVEVTYIPPPIQRFLFIISFQKFLVAPEAFFRKYPPKADSRVMQTISK